MASASFLQLSEMFPDRRRAATLALVVGIHLLLAFLFLVLTPPMLKPLEQVKTFTLLPSAPKPKATPSPKQHRAAAKKSPAKPAKPPPKPVIPPSQLVFGDPALQHFDLAKVPSHSDDRVATADAGTGRDSDTTGQPGAGPGGATLYNAEWYREPTNAELGGYIKHALTTHGSWAVIACKTAPQYRVEDCQELGESSPGSGLARAVREAAWQFRVLPPRIDGKPIMGAWVRIRIEFNERDGR